MSQAVQAGHPSTQQLSAFARGELTEAEDQQVESHLADCAACCNTLHDLSNDTLVGLLRDGDHQPPAGKQATLPPDLANHAKYEVQELLGEGGMGSVYKAQHRMMNRPVALKVINQQLVQNEAAVKRFHREVQAAARLAHPNIVTAHDADQAGDVHFLVMEYVDGIDLAELVRRRGPLPVTEACDYIRQAALGLQYAHELSMVHRDIKPQNLMVAGVRGQESGAREGRSIGLPSSLLTPDPRTLTPVVKILDFGLAHFATETAAQQAEEQMEDQTSPRAATHLTKVGAMMGTPDYMSPEQARDAHSADIRADIYSLGCTMYYVLTGQPPFGGASVLDKVLAHTEREPAGLSQFRSDIPPGLEEVLRRMIAKHPAERFQTPEELATALTPFVVRPLGGTNRPKPGPRTPSKRMIAIAAALLLGFFAILAGVIVVATDRGILQIQSDMEDVQLVVTSGGQEVATIDAKTGSQIRWLPTGEYEVKLVGDDNDIKLDKTGFQMTRLGRVIVNARFNNAGIPVIRSFTTAEQPITHDGVTMDDGGWKITATGDRTVRLVEVAPAPLAKGLFFYRAKLRTEDVKGKAYLQMWVRFPGMGEFFSKGLDQALKGTNGWAEYETPFILQEGQQPDLVKLNLTIEGGGTVWIKDIQLLGRSARSAESTAQEPQNPQANP